MFWRFVLAMAMAIILIVLAVILGDYAPWYLSWVLGTGFMVLLATAGAVLYESQHDVSE
ncbi:cytochrome bd oxidase small subunit, CydX/CbdX family [Segnochrobactraceae bacterium EtOH-i3]